MNLFDDANITSREYPLIYANAVGWGLPLLNLQFNLYRHSIIPMTRYEYYPFVNTSQIPIYITDNLQTGSSSFNMFFGHSHKQAN